MMDIDKAYCILTNKKKYWSHEIEEAKQFAEKIFILIAIQPEYKQTRLLLRAALDEENEE